MQVRSEYNTNSNESTRPPWVCSTLALAQGMQDCSGVLDCFSQSEDETHSCDQAVLVIGGLETELSNVPLSHDISDTTDNDTIDTALAEHGSGPPMTDELQSGYQQRRWPAAGVFPLLFDVDRDGRGDP